MVTERSDSQFAGLVNLWTGRFVRRFVKSEMPFLKLHLYQLSDAGFPLYCKWIFSLALFELGSCRICWSECGKRQQIRPNHAWTALLCAIDCCLVLFYLFYHFFRNVNCLWNYQNHVGMGVTHISEYRISKLTRTVHAVSESKIKVNRI